MRRYYAMSYQVIITQTSESNFSHLNKGRGKRKKDISIVYYKI